MKAYLQILSPGTADCPPSIVLHFDSQRYLINCGEGTQRACIEKRIRFAKLKTMLFTRSHWDCVGGVPGMLLTLADTGLSKIQLVGGPNLTHMIASTRQFVYRNMMAVEAIEFDSQNDKFADNNLRITAVQVYPQGYTPSPLPPSRAQPRHFGSTPYSQSRSDSILPAEAVVGQEEPESPVKLGSKRQSEDSNESYEVQSQPDSPEASEDAREIRQRVLTNMFNTSKSVGKQPSTAKKIKRDPRAKTPPVDESSGPVAGTDVDMIEAAEQAMMESFKSKGANGTTHGRGIHLHLPRTTPHPMALSFICQAPDYVGKFNKDIALQLGVKPGPLFGKLTKGESVISTSGETVHPNQVISGARAGRVFIIVDCPTVDHIESLVNADQFKPYQQSDESKEASCIVHMAGAKVIESPLYKEWMLSFGVNTQHIVAGEDYCPQQLVWLGQSLSCLKLSKLDRDVFPLPYYESSPRQPLEAITGLPAKVQMATPLLSFQIEPTAALDESEVGTPLNLESADLVDSKNIKPYLREYFDMAKLIQEDVSQAKASESAEASKASGGELVITALGTGSSHPSKYRNVSANLLTLPENQGTFMLDAGEGTFGQMYRLFGGYRHSADQKESVNDRVKNLKGIFISHLHADHHLGIVSVIDRWNKEHAQSPGSPPLYLIAPAKFDTFLSELADAQDFGYDKVQFIDSEDIVYHKAGNRSYRCRAAQQHLEGLYNQTGFDLVQTVDVIHCPWSYGIALRHRDDWKVVYSGDTRPCRNLVTAGAGASVLLHEATFEDDMQEEALAKRHSTTGEAIMVGEGMNAEHTLLTHFSQRYPKIPKWSDATGDMTVGICFDLMSIKLNQIKYLPKFLPALQALYSDQSDEAQEGKEEAKDEK